MLAHAINVGDNGINLDMTGMNIKFVNNYFDWKHASLLVTRPCMFLPVIRTGLCLRQESRFCLLTGMLKQPVFFFH